MYRLEESKQVYRLQGLSCTNCAAKFEKNIREIDTVEDVQLNFGAAKLTVQGTATVEQLEEAGAFDGIKVLPERTREPEVKQSFWRKRENITTGISLFFTVLGYVFLILKGETAPIAIGSFIAGIVIGGYNLFKIGIQNLTKLQFDMKTLMTIAIIGAAIIGEWAEGAVVVFLFALSEALESYSMDKARQSIKSLMGIAPKKATIRRGSSILDIDVEDVQINDIMIIKPGQKIAMDGEVVKGQSTINQAAITGESIPVHKTTGDEVYAGTMNEQGSLEVRVTKRVEDTTIAKIIHLVEEAQAERAPSQQFVDKFAKYYTPAIMSIALLIAVIPPVFLGASWSEWVYSGLAVLVVGCPCALVVSTPVAIVTAIGNAARNGVLIKGGIHLEETGHLRAIAFDKTGTLTKGKPEVTDVILLTDREVKEVLGIARAIEEFSQHPLASAIKREAIRLQAVPYEAEHFTSITGKGVKATVREEEYYIGSPTLFENLIPNSTEIKEKIAQLQAEGKTVMLLGTQSSIEALIAVADQVRKTSAMLIQKLHQLGIKHTVMLTGDNELTGKAIGSSLGLTSTKAELLPEDKLIEIKN